MMTASARAKKPTTTTINDILGCEANPSAELLALTLREILVRVETVCSVTGLSVQSIYRLISEGRFPRAVKITAQARAWRLSEIMDWIDTREHVSLGVASLDRQRIGQSACST